MLKAWRHHTSIGVAFQEFGQREASLHVFRLGSRCHPDRGAGEFPAPTKDLSPPLGNGDYPSSVGRLVGVTVACAVSRRTTSLRKAAAPGNYSIESPD
jgi:hypothetical protein